MAYTKLFDISTRETISGTRRVSQTISVPTGRLDKVALFLQGVVGESLTGNETTVQVAIYAVDSQYIPTGAALAVDSKMISEITTPSFYNFALSADVPTTAAVIVSLEGDTGNYVTWSYVNYDRGGEPMAVDDGAGWQQDFYRKMSYAAYSVVAGAVTLDDERPYTTPDFDSSDARPDTDLDTIQSAEIQAGTPSVLAANSREDFEAMDLWQGLIIGDTVAINVGTYVITLVVDHSGSMTWNDNNNTRIDFLKSFIDDIDTSLQNAATPSRYYLSLGARTKNGTWGSVNPWTEGFVEVSSGVEYDTTILVDGQQASLLVQQGVSTIGSFTTTLPEPLANFGPLNQAIIGRSSGQTADSSFVSATIKDVQVTTPPGVETIFSDALTSDLGWNFSDSAEANFSALGLDLTASSGTDQVGSRGMTNAVGSSFTIKSTIKIDVASGFYDLTAGVTAGRGTGYNQNPAGIWLVAGFERESTPQVSFEILKFNGRKIAKMRLLLNEESQNGTMLQNVVLSRNGVVIYEGLNEKLIDRGSNGIPLTEGTIYTYTIYSVDSAGNQSAIKTVTAAPLSSPRFPMGLAGFKAVEEVILGTTDDDVGKRRVKLSWVHAASTSASLAYNKIYILRREDRPPESVLDGTLVLSAESTDPLYNSPYYDFNVAGYDKSTYPCAGLTYYYAAFTENVSGAKCKLDNARQASVKISSSAKAWELLDPIVVPTDYDATPPGIPLSVVASPGPSEIKLSWTAGTGAKRYEVYYGETEYPSPGIDPDTGLRIYTAPTVESATPETLSPIYSGSDLSFVHRGLENYEPHYYVIVSYDAVEIPSAGVQTFARPDDTVTYHIPPLAPEEFSADPYNGEAIVVTWKLSLPDATNVTAYHGEAVNVVAVVTFDDDEDAPFTSDLSLDETSRSAEGYSLTEMPRDVIIDTFGLGAYSDLVTSIQTAQNEAQAAAESALAAAENPDENALAKESDTVDTSGPTVQTQTTVDPTTLPAISVDKQTQQVIINPISAINFGRGKSYEPNITTGTIKIAPSSSIQNFTKSAQCSFETSLSVTDRDTGTTLAKVYGGNGQVTFNNPFGLSIKDDPPQRINRRTAWKQNCCCPAGDSCFQTTGDPVECPGGATTSNGLGWVCEEVPGVYTILGGTFTFTVEATWKNLPITDPVNLEIRILDASTGIQSTVTTLPGASADGVLYTATSFKPEEITDRAGNPSGYTTNFNKATVTLPSQNVPGDYIIEVTARHNGYSRTTSLPVHYEHPLNIDIISKEFVPNGIDIAEQQARVYIGDPKWEASRKIPVPDGTVVKWTLIPGGNFKKTRPFYSTESLGGTGIKSSTNGGIAKNVFFGPGVDIEEFKCLTTEPCHDYEWYVVKADVSAYGQTKTGYNVIYLNPTQGSERDMNRIFMRPLDGFSADTIPCDGESISTWEVLGVAREDGDVTDMDSGAFFHDRVTSMGGLVPDLPDGTVVTVYVNAYQASSSASARDRLRNAGIPEIKTDLTNSQFVKANYAKATIIDGKATFQVRLNALANGKLIEQPEELPRNIVYGQQLPFNPSPIVFYMSSVANLTVRGKTLTFWGGGRDLTYSAPPCWLSFTEPLGTRQT